VLRYNLYPATSVDELVLHTMVNAFPAATGVTDKIETDVGATESDGIAEVAVEFDP
jgi:hypothetical protein